MADAATEKGFDEIRREVIESRNLVIKTDNQLKTLHAELKLVGKRQEDFERRQWISSGVAYAIFAALCVAGVVALSNARTASASNEKERLEKQVKDLTAQIDKLKADDSAVAATERSVSDVYKMMTVLQGDDRLKGIDALNKLDQTKLSPFHRQILNDRSAALRKEVGAGMLEAGKAAFRKQDWAGTVTQLNRFMAMNPVEEDAIDASYFLGNALVQQRKNEEAIPHLTRFVQGDKRAKNRDFAMLMLVQALDATGNREKAVEVAREALQTYPASEFMPGFRARLQPRQTAPAAAPAPAANPGPN